MAISRGDRAKQFLPFDSLKGLQEALREKEIEYVNRKELSEEFQEILSRKMQNIEKNDIVCIKYYIKGQYQFIKGKVKEINIISKKIILYEDKQINFIDIIDIKKT